MYKIASRHQQRRVEKAQKKARRRLKGRAKPKPEITDEDEVALGCKSSEWPEFKEILRAKLLFLNKVGILRHAVEAALELNRMKFKTGSGQRWTPRLIMIAKMKLFDWRPKRYH